MAVRRLLLRIGAACVAGVALGLLGIGVLLSAGFFVLDARLEAQRLTKEEAAAWAERGRPVVEAIYRFKHSRGLWPQRLDDLVPDLLTEEDIAPWDYQWSPWNYWSVSNRQQFPVACARYQCDRDGAGWFLSSRDSDVLLGVEQPLSEWLPVPRDELHRRTIEEFERRIRREPDAMSHAQGLASWYVRHGRLPEARAECIELLERFDDDWWPHAMRAHIDAMAGSEDDALKRLAAWVHQGRNAECHFLLARFCESLGRHDDALAALRGAVKLGVFRDTKHLTAWSQYYDAARYACERREFALVLELCDLWEQLAYTEQSYHALRAAACLGLGRFDQAKAHHRKAVEARKQQATWADQLDALGRAIDAKDIAFAYHPTRCPFHLLTDYQ